MVQSRVSEPTHVRRVSEPKQEKKGGLARERLAPGVRDSVSDEVRGVGSTALAAASEQGKEGGQPRDGRSGMSIRDNWGEEGVLGTGAGDAESESGQGEEGVRTGSGVTTETA